MRKLKKFGLFIMTFATVMSFVGTDVASISKVSAKVKKDNKQYIIKTDTVDEYESEEKYESY